MNFYQMGADHIGGRSYPWAAGYGPIRPIERMGFFGRLSEPFQEMKRKSWEINKSATGIVIDPGGRVWTDFIGCGAGYPGHFVSERVIRDLEEAGIPILEAQEMPIAKISAKALQKIDPPKYFILEALPGLEIRHEHIPLAVRLAAEKEDPPRFIKSILTKFNPDSWNGNHLFSPAQGTGTLRTLCTERVKELAEAKGWTNVHFRLLVNDAD
jgi:hypothetical protein